MIESKSALPISEIMARKDIIQMHWHPLDHNIFIALTADSFATYKY
jgi:L-ascorbate metabolism protein UlaG (beta-lactamase superfamily)